MPNADPSASGSCRFARALRPALSIVLGAALGCVAGGGCGDDDDHARSAHPSTAADAGSRAGGARDGGARDAGRDAPRALVGAVDETDIALGAVVAGDRARLFFCGGPDSYATATHWIQLTLDRDGAFSQRVSDDFAVSGRVRDARIEGELARPSEPSLPFVAELVREDTLAGLYEGSDDCGRVGLIVTQRSASDTARAQGACVGPGHTPQQVNPIIPIALDRDGTIEVELVLVDGTRGSTVHPAAAPDAE